MFLIPSASDTLLSLIASIHYLPSFFVASTDDTLLFLVVSAYCSSLSSIISVDGVSVCYTLSSPITSGRCYTLSLFVSADDVSTDDSSSDDANYAFAGDALLSSFTVDNSLSTGSRNDFLSLISSTGSWTLFLPGTLSRARRFSLLLLSLFHSLLLPRLRCLPVTQLHLLEKDCLINHS